MASAGTRSKPRRAAPTSRVLDRHRFAALVAPLREDPSFVAKPMFGFVGCYVGGRLVIVLADKQEPWHGVLLPTEREHHDALRRAFPDLRVHPVLGKWLYLPHGGDFAEIVARLVERIAGGDPRLGVEPETPKLPRFRFGGGP